MMEVDLTNVRQIWCEEDQTFYPEYKEKNGKIYQLDKEKFVYLQMLDLGLTEEEEALMNEPIHRWGSAWQRFMEENHPLDVLSMKADMRWEIIPRKIDREAYQLADTLREQFQRIKPRPMREFLKIAQWENELKTLTERQIMEDLVLVKRTA